jgi:hypothetical protein
MGNVDYYREEARRCSDLAATAPNNRIARRWDELAAEYIALAEQADVGRTGRAPLIDVQSQRQPNQQQQSKGNSVK